MKAEKIIGIFEEHHSKDNNFKQFIIHGDINGLNLVIKNKLSEDELYKFLHHSMIMELVTNLHSFRPWGMSCLHHDG